MFPFKAESSDAPSFDPGSLYPRSSDLDDDRTVNIYQSEIGDVGCVVWDAAIVLAKFYEHMMNIAIPEDQAGSPSTGMRLYNTVPNNSFRSLELREYINVSY